MSTITSPTLIAEILTGRMPLSDSFNRASAANTRMGVHHGFQLAYADSALGAIAYWPNRPYNTRYLKLGVSGASAAVIAAVNTNAGAQSESVLLTAILSAPLVIDLDLYTAGAADATTYRVYLQVAYIAPVVNNTTGLVSNIGSNDVSIIIEDEAVDFGSRKGLLLGRFNRQGKFVETIGDQAFNNSDINSDNTEGNLPNSMKNSTQLGAAIKAEVYRSASNLRKNIRIENVDDPAIAETLKSTTMPLAGITNSVAGSVGDLAIWNLPVAWSSITLLNEVINHGIYRDVEKFELFKCRFTNSMQFAFHRTPGHNRMVDWVGTADVDKLSTKSEIEVLEDFGSRQFIFDAKDSVFEGDLTLDLVLDFTGYAHDHPYKIFIRNLTVMGNLVINYGQSYLGMAGGTIGTIEYDNVQVFGADNIIRPWPCIKDALATDVALNAAYNALGFTRVRHFANTAAEINFTGYATTGPLLLKYWRDVSGACFSKGVIIPTYLHNRVVGSGGSLAMENPWLKEGADAGIILKNSTLPTSVLEHLLVSDPQVGSDTAGTMVRVKLQNCKYQKKAALVNIYGYVNTAEFYLAGDYIYSLTSINTDNPQDLRLKRSLADVVNVDASGAFSGSSVSVSGNAVAGNKIISTGSADIGAGAIIRGTTLTQGLTVAQGVSVGTTLAAGALAVVGAASVGLDIFGNKGLDIAQGGIIRGTTLTQGLTIQQGLSVGGIINNDCGVRRIGKSIQPGTGADYTQQVLHLPFASIGSVVNGGAAVQNVWEYTFSFIVYGYNTPAHTFSVDLTKLTNFNPNTLPAGVLLGKIITVSYSCIPYLSLNAFTGMKIFVAGAAYTVFNYNSGELILDFIPITGIFRMYGTLVSNASFYLFLKVYVQN